MSHFCSVALNFTTLTISKLLLRVLAEAIAADAALSVRTIRRQRGHAGLLRAFDLKPGLFRVSVDREVWDLR